MSGGLVSRFVASGGRCNSFPGFNDEILRGGTIPNVNANLLKKSQTLATDAR